MTSKLETKTVAILVTDGFEQSEMVGPRQALHDAGVQTVLIALKPGTVRAWRDGDWGDHFPVDDVVDDVKASAFDALLLPGGVINPDKLRLKPAAISFIADFDAQDKPIAAICHGPWTLIDAKAVKGKRVTSWPSLKEDLRNAGAEWTDEPCVRDHNLITSRKPDDIPAFSAALIDRLAQEDAPVVIVTDPVL